MMSDGFTVRVQRPYRFSPDGSSLRAVFKGDELGVPEEVSHKIAALMLEAGVAITVEEEQEEPPTAAEILDKAASKKKRAPRRKKTGK